MDAVARAQRDGEIMRAVRAGKNQRKIAMKHEITLARVKQIITRENKRRGRKSKY